MAQRFGGAHSPGGKGDDPRTRAVMESRAIDRSVAAAGRRANLLFIPPVILVFTSLGGGASGLVAGLVGGAVLALAAWLTRDGVRAHAAYDAQAIARRPAMPRKLFGSVLTGLGIAIAAWTGGNEVLACLLYGLAAGGLHVASFGIDPMSNKRMEGVDTFQQDRVARVVDEAEGYLADMTDRIATLGDRKLTLRVGAFVAMARKMIRTVQEDPRDLTEARRYLGVYLMGARDATARFADIAARRPDPEARADYEALLTDLETNFADRTERMLSGDRTDMDIEIKVLRDRLAREGVGD